VSELLNNLYHWKNEEGTDGNESGQNIYGSRSSKRSRKGRIAVGEYCYESGDHLTDDENDER